MGFFLELTPENQTEPTEENKSDRSFAYDILAIAKRMKLTFEELSVLRIKDLFKFADSYTGTYKENKKSRRKATQTDIDKFFG